MQIEVPDLVRQRAQANGAAGARWLDTLPVVVDALRSAWNLEIGATYRGGTAGYVAAATDESGRRCVLKIAMPLDMDERDVFSRSVRAHEITDGRGCAKLLRVDAEVPAVLLERLGPNLDELGMQLPEILEVIADTLQSFWRPMHARDEHDFPTGAAKAAWLRDYITTSWVALGHPCSQRVVERAVTYCDERAAAFDPKQAVLVHGDAHGWNTVSAPDGGYKFVDPEGIWSEPAHDLSVPMREYNEPLLAGATARLTRARADHLADLCNVDADAIWQWGFIERVSTGFANLRDFDNDAGMAFLEVAERCL